MNEMCEVKEGCALFIGRVGENLVTKLKFPIQDILETMPGAEIRLLFKRPGDLISYPVNSIIEDGEFVWNVSSIDTAIKGWGKAELYAMEGEVVKLSIIHNVIVAESLLPEGAVPDPLQNWYQDIINASEQVENDRIIVQGIKSDVQEIKAAFELELVPINDRLSEIEGELPSFATKQELQSETTARVEAINAIEDLIPDQASSSNQLADKDFVNSSISSNAAYFKGTFNSIEELEQVTDVTNNDYAYVIETDSAGNVVYNRYKYNSDESEWMFEYALNNSSFTAAQWATINSGITASDVDQIESNKNAIQQINVDLQNKANVNDVYSKTEADEEFATKTELENGLSGKADAAEVNQLKEDIDTKAGKTALARTDRSLDYLWKISKGTVYDTETVEGNASEVTVPSGAMDYAELKMLGGMSRKSTQCIKLSDRTGSANGVDFVCENGVITLNGTCTETVYINFGLAEQKVTEGITYTLRTWSEDNNKYGFFLLDNNYQYKYYNFGSSAIRIFGLLISALANATLCFSPPLKQSIFLSLICSIFNREIKSFKRFSALIVTFSLFL